MCLNGDCVLHYKYKKQHPHQQHKDSPPSPEVQIEGYVGVLRSLVDGGTQHVTQSQENEPVLVRDVTSSSHLYQPILVENTYP